MKKSHLLVFTLLTIITVFPVYSSSLKEYCPIIMNKKQILTCNKALLTKVHLDNLEKVLNYYVINYERKSNTKLLLDQSVYKDTDYIWNLTSKANDKKWLQKHSRYNNEKTTQ